ncbi:MAG: hypothetical protein R3E35_14485 [Rhodocyclaceae bacterium]
MAEIPKPKTSALLKPLPEDLMERYRVSRRMSNARNEGDACMAPYQGD